MLMSRKTLLIWLCALAGLLIVNTIAHLSSPAYSAYRDNLRYAQSQLHSLSNALLRFNAILATNMIAEIGRTVDLKARPALSTAPGVDASAAAPGAAGRDEARLDSVSLPADAYPYLVNGFYYVRICGWDYTLGDSFSGSPIVDINPLEFRTLSTVYRFNSARRSTTTQKKKRMKNMIHVLHYTDCPTEFDARCAHSDASKIISLYNYGWMVFDTPDDYQTWKSQFDQ